MIAALALPDSLSGAAYFTAGLLRAYWLLTKTNLDLVSNLYCARMPFTFLWMIATPLSSFMMFTINVDRLIACLWSVVRESRFFGFTSKMTIQGIFVF